MNINDFNIKNLTTISIVQEIKNGVRLVPDIIKPGRLCCIASVG